MDQSIRNKLRNVVTQCRKLLEEAVSQVLQGQFGIHASGKKDEVHVEDEGRMQNLSDEDKGYRRDILAHLEHIQALGYKAKDALAQLVREIAFTHLNRLCAYKMMEAREVWVGGQRFREAVSRGMKSQGFQFYLADHADDKKLFDSGHQDVAYRHFLGWLGALLSEEIGVLFSPTDPANRLFPPQRVLDDVLALLNSDDLNDTWAEDETIGWVYQYFTPKELRDQVRKESAAPRNSYELAFRNQFFTPRYVVEFLTDNTLGRIWYEMRKGDTKLKDQCHYMVRRPSEVFLTEGQSPPEPPQNQEELSQEELLKQPVHIPHRPKKDPRELRILDPACGSGHFLLYCFALLLTIYEEAYADPDLGPKLKEDYPTLDALRRDVPRLILAHNLHGIDIDLRASQIAALALWLRCQRAYGEMGLKQDRPKITKSNFVCAEPMPGEKEMLDEFLKSLKQDRLETLIQRVMQVPEGSRIRATQSMVESLNELVRLVWDRMRLAGEAGSLLKIEEELQEAVRKGQEEWEEKQPLFRFTEFSLTETPKESYVRFVPGEGVNFWERAEALVLAALRDYARHAANGVRLQRQLFADDAERGFAFIDICQKRFDVVLMNPPFGEPATSTRSFMEESYESLKNEIMACFVGRGNNLLVKNGRLGAILSRTLLFNSFSEPLRRDIFDEQGGLAALADLGYGVLDEALVETACIVTERHVGKHSDTVCFRLLRQREKESSLRNLIDSLGRGTVPPDIYIRRINEFLQIFRFPIAYWLPRTLLSVFQRVHALEPTLGSVKVGLSTADNFQFLRLSWEVPRHLFAYSNEQTRNGKRWVALPKGGEYEPYYDDIHLVIDWINEGETVRSNPGSTIRSSEFYFSLGGTFPYRTTSAFCLRALPRGVIFSDGGQAVLPTDGSKERALGLIAYFNTRIARQFLEVFLGEGDAVVSGSAARNYIPRAIGAVPVPDNVDQLGEHPAAQLAMKHALQLALEDETSRLFELPGVLIHRSDSIHAASEKALSRSEASALQVLRSTQELESLIGKTLGFNSEEEKTVEEEFGSHPNSLAEGEIDRGVFSHLWGLSIDSLVDEAVDKLGAARFLSKKMYYADRRLELLARTTNTNPRSVVRIRQETGLLDTDKLAVQTKEVASYAVGCILGRWDIRFATGQATLPEVFDPFEPPPLCSPGMLHGPDGFPAKDTPKGYSVRIDWDGIIPDDPDHSDDIVRRVREVLELIWKDRAEAIEKEACEILGVKELRDYFRKPGKGGFWDDHVSRYSKSRRKAPIYWLLQSSKKNYALWLYYHRLDKDMLFKARQNYVEPKIRLEQTRLDSLRSQKTTLGADAKGAKKIDKDIERQEALLGELKDFAEKLERAAKLNFGNPEKLNSEVVYDPDLNDGVVLSIAPLWELVPWKEAKKYWEELLEGQYEWSSMGKLLRKKGLV